MKYFWTLFILLSCSHINPNEQAYYQEVKKIRHGITQVKPNVSPIPRPTNQGSTDLTKLGEQIFKRDCARCHGETGEGNGPLAKEQENLPLNLKLTVRESKHFDFYFKISTMEKSMPGWEQTYTDEERMAIVSYLKTL